MMKVIIIKYVKTIELKEFIEKDFTFSGEVA